MSRSMSGNWQKNRYFGSRFGLLASKTNLQPGPYSHASLRANRIRLPEQCNTQPSVDSSA
jgi:hypothetical protein